MNKFTWDGTESGLYNLLIWWYGLVPYKHMDDCEPEPGSIHCCENQAEPPNALIGMEPRASKHGGPLPIYFEFTKGKRAGTRYDMSPGDTIFYEDGKFSYLESFECVVISQDWP